MLLKRSSKLCNLPGCQNLLTWAGELRCNQQRGRGYSRGEANYELNVTTIAPLIVFTSPGKWNGWRQQRFLSALSGVRVIGTTCLCSMLLGSCLGRLAISPVTTTVVVSPFAIIVSWSYVQTTVTMCADLCRSCADVCRRHLNRVKDVVMTTLVPSTPPTPISLAVG